MTPNFETIEEYSIASKVSDATVSIRLRRQLNYHPSRFTSGPYWLDLLVGSVHRPYYCVDHHFAQEAATRFLLEHVKGIMPVKH